eukprot:2468461-Prymnesium_polylepis.1
MARNPNAPSPEPAPLPRATAAGASQVGSACPVCNVTFCTACDDLIHETLHVCPGCASKQEEDEALPGH